MIDLRCRPTSWSSRKAKGKNRCFCAVTPKKTLVVRSNKRFGGSHFVVASGKVGYTFLCQDDFVLFPSK